VYTLQVAYTRALELAKYHRDTQLIAPLYLQYGFMLARCLQLNQHQPFSGISRMSAKARTILRNAIDADPTKYATACVLLY
jgi:hypothetical protein